MSECYIHGLQNQFVTNVYCNYSSKLKSVLFFNFHQTILREWSYNHLFQNDTMGKSEVKYTFFTLYCLHINYHSAFSVLAPYSYFIFSSFFFISKFLSNRKRVLEQKIKKMQSYMYKLLFLCQNKKRNKSFKMFKKV